MNRITAEHVRRNQQARDGWELYAAHRRCVTELLASASQSKRDRLCVLGAGNCNDLDLQALGKAFETIHLVDLDEAALAFGMNQQRPANPEKFHLHGNVDVTGVASLFGNWCPQDPPSEDELQTFLAKTLSAEIAGLPVPCDVVVSVGLLTQLFDSLAVAVGSDHPTYLNLVQSIRLRHMRLLVELLRPGGRGFLITEVVSSDTFAELSDVPDHALAAVIVSMINQRNFFTGTNPVVLRALFQSDPVTAPLISKATILEPWKWQFITRLYAVCALRVDLVE